jgi:protease IV
LNLVVNVNESQSSQQSAASAESNSQQPTIVVQMPDPQTPKSRWRRRFVFVILICSVMLNFVLYFSFAEYFTSSVPPSEKFHSGNAVASDKIAIVRVSGTLMPPLTRRVLRQIERASDDPQVKGVVVSIDSPGGLVADSHEVFHRLGQLREKKPIYVTMKRLAASGGLYIAMGAGEEGKIYAEPTTWTGSIGVIIPRYDVSELAEKFGVTDDSLKSGEFKDSLSPFRPLTDAERKLWGDIIEDSFDRFVKIIAENRSELDYDTVRNELGTGQIFTADDAKKRGLVDEIGYEDEALEALQKSLGLSSVRIVTYSFPPQILELLTGMAMQHETTGGWRSLLDATVPRAMYFCSSGPGIPSWDAAD